MCLVTQSCSTLCNPMDCNPPGSSIHWDSPGKNTGVGCHASLQDSNSGVEPKYPTLQVDSLLSEPFAILAHLSSSFQITVFIENCFSYTYAANKGNNLLTSHLPIWGETSPPQPPTLTILPKTPKEAGGKQDRGQSRSLSGWASGVSACSSRGSQVFI